MYEVFSLSRLFVMAVFHCGLVSLSPSLPTACPPQHTHPGCYHNKITGDTLHLIVILASNVTMLRDIFVDITELS